ncbi:sulfotransferase family protein [Croceicoccus marinus]|uniref:Nodulation protein NoeE n=1 Tax=Croceicoccus marinus TaxID=450378 RepID=A0A1Z1FGG3_9SPHN|nr:sulfotransferase [Croceicoccus marinus]ARU17797.1 nodulation protein NoeE [Croceicoccus marinus]
MKGHRYVFVAGLHRSGTSLVARLLGEHPDIAAITDAPVPENEGCYLQGAIPHTARHGVPGHFATDPDQHLVEGCALDRLETRVRMEADWSRWFDSARPWRVEKSPVNLTRTRLLQSLFPMSQFIIVTRHPAFTAEAMRKWVDVEAIGFRGYWQGAHDLVLADLEYLHCAMIVRYEDLVERPQTMRRAMFAFLDLPVCESARQIANGNRRYLDSAQRSSAAYSRLGYAPGASCGPLLPRVRHPLRAIVERVEEVLANTDYAEGWRMSD